MINNIPPELLAMLQQQQGQMQAPELTDWRQYTDQEKDKREMVDDDTMGPLTEEQRYRNAYERKSGMGQGKSAANGLFGLMGKQ